MFLEYANHDCNMMYSKVYQWAEAMQTNGARAHLLVMKYAFLTYSQEGSFLM